MLLRVLAAMVRQCCRGWNVETAFATLVVVACIWSLYISMVEHAPRSIRDSPTQEELYFHKNVNLHYTATSGNLVNKYKIQNTSGNNILDSTSKSVTIKPDPPVLRPWFSELKPVKLSKDILTRKHPVLHDIKYIIEGKDICSTGRVDILLYFHSSVNHYTARKNIRETYAAMDNFKSIKVMVVFFLGVAPNPEDGPGVEFENARYGDIVQGDFQDTLSHLTTKSVFAMKWISLNCANARYVIKADDDVFVDIFGVAERLIPEIWQSTKTLMCNYHKQGANRIARNHDSRWYIPEHLLLNQTHYGDFCSGYTVVFTTDLAPVMYEASFEVPLIPSVEDAYTFGLLLEHMKGVNFIQIAEKLLLSQDPMIKDYKEKKNSFVAALVKRTEDMHLLWNASLSVMTRWGHEQASVRITNKINMLTSTT